MMGFEWILIAHAIGDWGLQPGWMATAKATNPLVMAAHAALYAGVVCLALQHMDRYAVWKLAFLFLGHWLCDGYLRHAAEVHGQSWALVIDQAWHVFQLLICWEA